MIVGIEGVVWGDQRHIVGNLECQMTSRIVMHLMMVTEGSQFEGPWTLSPWKNESFIDHGVSLRGWFFGAVVV